MVELYGHAWPKPSPGPTVDPPKHPIRDGRVAAGFVAAIQRCGNVLAAHAPPDGSADELPDRLYVM
jgi:uncharacterized membrane protein